MVYGMVWYGMVWCMAYGTGLYFLWYTHTPLIRSRSFCLFLKHYFCENFLCKFPYNSCAKYTECSTHLFLYLCGGDVTVCGLAASVWVGLYDCVCVCMSFVLNFNWDIKWQALVAAGSFSLSLFLCVYSAAFLPFVCNLHNILLNVD